MNVSDIFNPKLQCFFNFVLPGAPNKFITHGVWTSRRVECGLFSTSRNLKIRIYCTTQHHPAPRRTSSAAFLCAKANHACTYQHANEAACVHAISLLVQTARMPDGIRRHGCHTGLIFRHDRAWCRVQVVEGIKLLEQWIQEVESGEREINRWGGAVGGGNQGRGYTVEYI